MRVSPDVVAIQNVESAAPRRNSVAGGLSAGREHAASSANVAKPTRSEGGILLANILREDEPSPVGA
jgi:hypothetical protein